VNSSDTQPDQFCLEIGNGPNAGDRIPLGEKSISIGRSPEADVTLDDPAASRKHVEIVFRAGCHMVIDQSTNGTYVNGEIVTEHALQPGDEIQVGDTSLTYIARGAGQEASASAVSGASEQGVSPMLIVVGIAAVGILMAVVFYGDRGTSDGGQKASNAGAATRSTTAAAEELGAEPTAGVAPRVVVEGAKRMLADARLRPHFVPQVIRALRRAKFALGKGPAGADQQKLAEQIDTLSKRALELQDELSKTFQRRARLFAERGDIKNARQSFELVKAVMSDPRAPAYVRAEDALQKLPRPRAL